MQGNVCLNWLIFVLELGWGVCLYCFLEGEMCCVLGLNGGICDLFGCVIVVWRYLVHIGLLIMNGVCYGFK